MEVQDQLVELHPEAKEISFKHKFVIEALFKKKIQGILGINYFSLMIIDGTKKLSIYSSCPALEYNLIDNELWQYDRIFYQENHTNGSFFFWDELYLPTFKKTLVKEKETKFGFLFGFCVMKQLSDIFVIYSFATKSKLEKEIYRNSKDTLFKIGGNCSPLSIVIPSERRFQSVKRTLNHLGASVGIHLEKLPYVVTKI